MTMHADKQELDAEIARMEAFMASDEFAAMSGGGRDAYLSSIDRLRQASADLAQRIQSEEA